MRRRGVSLSCPRLWSRDDTLSRSDSGGFFGQPESWRRFTARREQMLERKMRTQPLDLGPDRLNGDLGRGLGVSDSSHR